MSIEHNHEGSTDKPRTGTLVQDFYDAVSSRCPEGDLRAASCLESLIRSSDSDHIREISSPEVFRRMQEKANLIDQGEKALIRERIPTINRAID